MSGNSNYKYVNILKNPKNDASDIATILTLLGFKVNLFFDLSISEMEKAFREYLIELEEYSTGLFFYAGHGMQIDGENCLVPVDCKVIDKAGTILSCYKVNDYLRGMEAYKGKTNICILDACRNNPFAMTVRGIACGFAPFTVQPKGTIIAFSTSADNTASDGQGNNGLYTSALKETLLIPNLKIEEVFKSTRIKVLELSNGEQISWEHSCLVGDFYFSVKEIPVVEDIEDSEIFAFVKERETFYENATDNIYDIECMPFVDAYHKYKIPIIKILRAYSRIQYKKQGKTYNDSTIDEINIGYLESWGFYRENRRWYYKNIYVELGDPLPIPQELLPLKPVDGCEIEVTGEVKCECFDEKILFILTTNFPDETPIIFHLKGNSYFSQSSGIVMSGLVSSEGFTNKGNKLDNGLYRLIVSSPIYSVLPASVKSLFGDRNRNMVGENVKYSPIGGNTAELKFNVVIKENEVTII